LALFVRLDSAPERCFLVPRGDPFFFPLFAEAEEATLRLVLETELSVVSEDCLLPAILDTVLLLLVELELELELVRARRLELRVEFSELEALPLEVLAEDASFPFLVCFADVSEPLETLAEVADTTGLEGDFLCVVLANDSESLEILAEDVDTTGLIDLFVMRCAVSLSDGVLLLNIEAFVDDARPLTEDLFLEIDGGATFGDFFCWKPRR